MTTTHATESQISYAQSLLASREVSDTFRATLGDITALSKREASALIDTLRSFPYAPRAPRTSAPTSDLVEGIYFANDEVYKVKRSSAGRMYALKLVGSSWSYDSAHVRGLTLAHRITPEQASEFGIRTGVCAICGIPLTNLDSLERGIGPVCARREW